MLLLVLLLLLPLLPPVVAMAARLLCGREADLEVALVAAVLRLRNLHLPALTLKEPFQEPPKEPFKRGVRVSVSGSGQHSSVCIYQL